MELSFGEHHSLVTGNGMWTEKRSRLKTKLWGMRAFRGWEENSEQVKKTKRRSVGCRRSRRVRAWCLGRKYFNKETICIWKAVGLCRK